MQEKREHIPGSNIGPGPMTMREATKDCFYGHPLLEWTPEQIPKSIQDTFWEAHMGGTIEDEAGERQLSNQQLAIRLTNAPRYSIYDILPIMAKIRCEAQANPPTLCLHVVIRLF